METAFDILKKLSFFLAHKLATPESFQQLGELFQHALSMSSVKVQVSATAAVCELISVCDDVALSKQAFQHLIPSMLTTFGLVVHANNPETTEAFLLALMDVTMEEAKFFSSHIQALVAHLVEYLSIPGIPELCHLVGVELLVSLAEGAGSSLRKLPNNYFSTSVYPVYIKMLMSIEDYDPPTLAKWSSSYHALKRNKATKSSREADAKVMQDKNPGELYGEHQEDDIAEFDDDSGLYESARQACYRSARAIGSAQFWPVVYPIVLEALQQQSNWKARHAALATLTETVACIPSKNLREKEAVVSQIVQIAIYCSASDEHPRVRYEALTLISSVGEYVAGSCTKHVSTILPCLVQCMSDPVVRLQAHAGMGICYFLDNAKRAAVKPYIKDLLDVLLDRLQGSSQEVQESSLLAISSLTENVQDWFSDHYDRPVQVMKEALSGMVTQAAQTNQPLNKQILWVRLLECLSQIYVSVEHPSSHEDAQELATYLAQAGKLEEDSPFRQEIFLCWNRLSTKLQNDMAPFLPSVMPYLLLSAAAPLRSTSRMTSSRLYKPKAC